MALIYFANRVRSALIFEKNYYASRTSNFWEYKNLSNPKTNPIGYTTRDFYKAKGIDPNLYTVAMMVKEEDLMEDAKAIVKAREGKIYLGIPVEEYKKNKQCGSILETEYEELSKQQIIKPGYKEGQFIIAKISECYNLQKGWQSINRKNLTASLRKDLLFSLFTALINIEILVSSSIGLKAFPSDTNIINGALTHPLNLKYPHLTAGTLMGIVGFLFSLVACIYFTKKLWDLSMQPANTENNATESERPNEAARL
jgi:hypothetical protein